MSDQARKLLIAQLNFAATSVLSSTEAERLRLIEEIFEVSDEERDAFVHKDILLATVNVLDDAAAASILVLFCYNDELLGRIAEARDGLL